MKAMLSNTAGGPETLEYTDISIGEPKPDEIRIRVKAAGVNFPDTLIIRDLYQIKPPRPFAPGGEIAGIIESMGVNVKGFGIGDRVLAVPGHGGFVTHINVPAFTAVKIPDEMPFEDAACFIFTYGTSHYALKDRAKIKAGETLLVLGAAGGVGVAAIEIAKAHGVRVIAAVSSEEKAQFCKHIGADDTIIYPKNMNRDEQKKLSASIKESSGKSSIDVVYDAVGGDYAEPCIRALAWNGRFLVVGFPAGIPKIPLNLALLKSCQIIGVFWGAFTVRNPKQHQEYLKELFTMYRNKKIKPKITATFSLEEAAKALKSVEERKSLGKVVLTMK